ncbi:MAG: thiamine biosynthesis protein ThiI [Methanomassiliicoccales archaeon PtaU1.Bin124]|nr:MAG: thiamine biosynthesis protein ThiI [Methanomassiliicoccales archaeon PtaU1.Bin124]
MKVVSLISGGIDSPVAAYVMAAQGCDVIALHMDNRPYSATGSVKKAARLADIVSTRSGRSIDFRFAPHGRNQEINARSCNTAYQCVLCKRLMLKVAKAVALKEGAEAIVTGESLGQVASQTLQNLRAEQSGLEFPVIRPLIGLDKLEIEAIAKKIGTYEVSISGLEGPACTILPPRVVTMALPEEIHEEEAKVDIEEMVAFAVSNLHTIKDLDTSSS